MQPESQDYTDVMSSRRLVSVTAIITHRRRQTDRRTHRHMHAYERRKSSLVALKMTSAARSRDTTMTSGRDDVTPACPRRSCCMCLHEPKSASAAETAPHHQRQTHSVETYDLSPARRLATTLLPVLCSHVSYSAFCNKKRQETHQAMRQRT